jgi:imidazolonepropionase-like amidohydrolase
VRRHAILAVAVLVATSSSAQVVAICGGTVITAAGPPIEDGTVVLQEGKIAAVGREVTIPGGAEVVDATNKFVMPGLIDAMTYYGIDAADLTK